MCKQITITQIDEEALLNKMGVIITQYITPMLKEKLANKKQLMIVTEVCTYLRISRSTFYRFKKMGYLQPVKAGRRTLVHKKDMERLLVKQNINLNID